MIQSPLWNVVEIKVSITAQSLGKFCQRTEIVGFEYLGNTAMETRHHAIGLRPSGLNQTMFNSVLLTSLVETVIARGDSVT